MIEVPGCQIPGPGVQLLWLSFRSYTNVEIRQIKENIGSKKL